MCKARARETKGPDRPGGIVWSTNTTHPPPGGSDSVVAPARVARVEAVRGVVVAVAVDGRALAARPRQDVVDVREVVLGRVLRRPRLTGGRRAGGRRRPERRPEVGRRPPARARGGAPVRLAAPSAAGAPLRVAALAERSQEVPQRRVDGVQGLARAARKVGPDLARLHEQRRQRLLPRDSRFLSGTASTPRRSSACQSSRCWSEARRPLLRHRLLFYCHFSFSVSLQENVFIIQVSIENGYSHYFYGCSENTINLLRKNLSTKYPGLNIKAAISPPFQPLEDYDFSELANHINDLKPTFFWCGLGAPKQERLMALIQPHLKHTIRKILIIDERY